MVVSIDTVGLGRVAARPDWAGERIAVLGDVHANHPALVTAATAVRDAGITRVVCHGDLLTYGCAPETTLEALTDLLGSTESVLLVGNHDPWYFATGDGGGGYDRLPGGDRRFIADSVRWTQERVGTEVPAPAPGWHDACTVADVLIGHAGPFGPGRWPYLNSEADEREAGTELARRGARVGVFGHTHRPRLTRIHGEQVDRRPTAEPAPLAEGEGSWVLNTGTVGQPRGEGSTWLELDLGAGRAALHPIDYDLDEHLAAIRDSGLPADTVERLCGYFEAP